MKTLSSNSNNRLCAASIRRNGSEWFSCGGASKLLLATLFFPLVSIEADPADISLKKSNA